jgi:hypothetical protein
MEAPQMAAQPAIQITSPEDLISVNPAIENKVEIKKACQFLGHSDVYLVAQIMSGVVSHKMKGVVDGRSFDIVELESKLGSRIAKEGMTIGLTIRGLPREAFDKGKVVSFRL